MAKVKLIAVLVLAVLGILLVVQNTASVPTRLLVFKADMPIAVLLLIATLVGFALGVLVSLMATGRRKAK